MLLNQATFIGVTFVMATVPNVLEELREYSAYDLYEIIIRSYYCPTFYILHAMFVCLYLRWTGFPSFTIWRSFILGFLMTTSPRYVFSIIMGSKLPEFGQSQELLKTFAIIWACFNICPYDLVFKFARRPVALLVLRVLDALSQAQNISQLCFTSAMTLSGEKLRAITLVSFCMCSSMIVDELDRMFIGSRPPLRLYQAEYAKRMIAAVVMVGALATASFGSWIHIEMEAMSLILAIVFVLFAVVDFSVEPGSLKTVDVIFPRFWSVFATYWPLSAKRGKCTKCCKTE